LIVIDGIFGIMQDFSNKCYNSQISSIVLISSMILKS
jgi:hypothetical protein